MARDFPGTDNNLLQTSGSPGSLSAIITAEGAYSMAAWIRPDAVNAEGTVVSKYNGFGPILRLLSNAKMGFFTVDAGSAGQEAIGATSLSASVWSHVGGSWDSSTMRVWVNGVMDGSTAMNTQHTSQAGDWAIGCRPGGTVGFNGLIAEVALWSVALTADEFASLAAGVSPRRIRPESIVAYWPLYGSSYPEPNYAGQAGTTYMGQIGTVGVGTLNPPVSPFEFADQDEAELYPALLDAATVYIDLMASGLEIGYDEALVPLTLSVTSAEVREVSDAATVYVDLQVSGTEIKESTDAGTVYLDMSVQGGECFSTYSPNLLGEGEADTRWTTGTDDLRWSGSDSLRWSDGEIVVEGINC